MGNKGKQGERKQRVACEFCEGFIFLESYLESGDLICCEECGTEFLVDSREPLFLKPVEEDDDDDVSVYDIMIGYDDDYNDGRYD